MRCRDEHGRKDAFLQAQCDILETCVSFSFHLLYCGRLGRLPLKYREIDEGKKGRQHFFRPVIAAMRGCMDGRAGGRLEGGMRVLRHQNGMD